MKIVKGDLTGLQFTTPEKPENKKDPKRDMHRFSLGRGNRQKFSE